MTQLRDLQEIREDIIRDCRAYSEMAMQAAMDNAFEKLDQCQEYVLLPVEKKLIFFQMLYGDLRDYDYRQYLKSADSGFSFTE